MRGEQEKTVSEIMQYADKSPEGYRLVTIDEPAKNFDLAFYNHDSEWRPVTHGQNIVGASARVLWPGIMAVARRVPAN